MPSLSDLPNSLRHYLVAIIAAGPLLCLAALGADRSGLGSVSLWQVLLLAMMAAGAERVTIHLTHKTAVNPVTACSMAMILIIPVGGVGLLALLSGLAGQLLRKKGDPIEAAFNGSQGALAVLASALIYRATQPLDPGPPVAGIGTLGAIVAAGVTLHLVNTALVALAAAFQLQRRPWSVFVVHLRQGLGAHIALVAVGVTVARLTLDAPELLPTLVLPLWLVRKALGENVRLREDTQSALATLVDVVELRDPYTAGHSRRVAELAHALALELGLTAEEADVIESAGRVHDLGKVAVDPAVLTKPGALTPDEFAEMQRHPALGAAVIQSFAAFRAGVQLVRHHHERWDGAGYPDSVAGEEIPFGARILAVADTYDALTSARPYRTALPRERALAILRDGAGTQWDANVIAALLMYLDRGESTLAREPVGSTAPLGVAV
jgi:HD-GYP domain-containing protein (c-di-GMP phosphodiesterase class II)